MWCAREEVLFIEDIVPGVISVCWKVEDGRGGRTPDCVATEGVWIAGLAEKVIRVVRTRFLQRKDCC